MLGELLNYIFQSTFTNIEQMSISEKVLISNWKCIIYLYMHVRKSINQQIIVGIRI